MAEERAGPPSKGPEALLAQASGALKIFPLPEVVLFPGTPTPFHVFEPRYRALVADALAGDRMLAVPTLLAQEGAPLARPPVHRIAGAGFIEAERKLEDGRYDILVRCLARVRLVEEIERGKPYREFRAEILHDVYPAGGPAALAQSAAALTQCVFELADALPRESGAEKLADAAARAASPGALADLVASAVVSEPAARLQVVEELDVARRLEIVIADVAGVVLVLKRGRTARA